MSVVFFVLSILCLVNETEATSKSNNAELLSPVLNKLRMVANQDKNQRFSIVAIDDDHIDTAIEFVRNGVDGGTAARDYKYEIGSLTKLFVAASIYNLSKDGKLGFDVEISNYLPRLKSTWLGAVTIRDLLCHASGLPRGGYYSWYPISDSSLMDFVERIPNVYSPKQKYLYSNLGYLVLGEIIRSTSGIDPKSFIIEDVLKKNKLNNTGFLHSTLDRSSFVMPISKANNRIYMDKLGDLDAGMYSTISDLAKFAKWIIRADSGKMMEKLSSFYGLNLNAYSKKYCMWGDYLSFGDTGVIYKMGETDGYRCGYFYAPKTRKVILIMGNGHSLPVNECIGYVTNRRGAFRELPLIPVGSSLSEFEGEYTFVSPVFGLLHDFDFRKDGNELKSKRGTVSLKIESTNNGRNRIVFSDSKDDRFFLFPRRYAVDDIVMYKDEFGGKYISTLTSYEPTIIAETILHNGFPTAPERFLGKWINENQTDTVLIERESNGVYYARISKVDGGSRVRLEKRSDNSFRFGERWSELDVSIEYVDSITLNYRMGELLHKY